jgi:hypothetical protein
MKADWRHRLRRAIARVSPRVADWIVYDVLRAPAPGPLE